MHNSIINFDDVKSGSLKTVNGRIPAPLEAHVVLLVYKIIIFCNYSILKGKHNIQMN
jgi:hypothetical protein